jgi:hypothetical protein
MEVITGKPKESTTDGVFVKPPERSNGLYPGRLG